MKKDMIIKVAAIFVIILHLAGCSSNKYVKTEDKLCVQAMTKVDPLKSEVSPKADAMAASERVLADMHFEIEKLEMEAGYIRTRPLAGAQTFEFWRSDNAGAFNRAEANLHSIRRTVELDVNEQEGQICINCRANTQRLSISGEQTSGQGYKATGGRSSMQKLSREPKENMTWIDLGRDGLLETKILKGIEKRLTADKKRLAATKEGKAK